MVEYNTASIILNPNLSQDYASVIEKYESDRLIDKKVISSLSQPYQIRAGAYTRVSTLNQARKDKTSLPEQKAQIVELITSRNWTLVDTYSDGGISGGSMVNRNDFNRMIEDAYLGKFDVIIGWSTDRLARNVDEMTQLRSQLRKHNIQITTVKEPAEVLDPRRLLIEGNESLRKIMAYFQDWTAENDKSKIVERFRLGKLGKAKKGLIPAKVPYGYKKIIHFKNGDPNQKIEQDIQVEAEAVIIQEIFNLYDQSSWGMRRIAENLNLRGVPAPKGGLWGYSTIKYHLQNPTYSGLVRYGWRLCKSKESRTRLNAGHKGIICNGQHKPIIDPEQFQRVQLKMSRRRELGGRAVHSHGLLTGILKCGRCGGPAYLCGYDHWLAYQKDKSERGKYKKSASYMCAKYAQYGRAGCSKRYILSQKKIEDLVISKIKLLSTNKIAQDEFVKRMRVNNLKAIKVQVKNAEVRLGEFEIQKERLKEAYLKGVINLVEYQDDLNQVKVNEEKAQEYYLNLQNTLQQEQASEKQSETALIALADFDKIWAKADFNQKKDLLQAILKKVTVNGNQVQIEFVTE